MAADQETWNARVAMLVVIGLCWSGAFTAIKVALRYVDPFDLTVLRFLVAAPALLGVLWLRGLPKVERIEYYPFVAVALVTVPVYHFCLNWGETTVTAGVAALIVATGPMWTALFSTLILREALTPIKVGGIFLSLFGVVMIVVGSGAELTITYTLGAFVVLLAPMSWAYATVLSKPLVMRHGAERVTAAATLGGTVVILPILLTGTTGRLGGLQPDGVGAILFLGIFATIVGYLGFNYALRRLTSSETMSFVYLNPVFGLVWSYLLLSEVPTPVTVLGGSVVILGIILAQQRLKVGPSRVLPAER
ncbi:MAG: EamA family transporter [Euryarchaeota archaeon]|nr:EamA family transporter [Euryarchaeota archaeon]